jgi:hypothetical protein
MSLQSSPEMISMIGNESLSHIKVAILEAVVARSQCADAILGLV